MTSGYDFRRRPRCHLYRSRFPTVVIGGGQAGLAMSYCLAQQSIDHVVLERHRVGWEWSQRRWDSFCLVTPNWQCQLPGFPYPGDDPDGFMVKDDIVGYLEAYAAETDPPLVEGVTVSRLSRAEGSQSFEIETGLGAIRADHVVVATGPYNIRKVPPFAAQLPDGVLQLHSSEYRRAGALPPGAVLVVGTGQSGCQIAEDLHREGRQVHLAVGGAPRVARRYRGKDVIAWLDEVGYYDKTIDDHPLGERVRENTNHYVTGRDGGHDIDLRAFALEGMQLYGHLRGLEGTTLAFAADLEANLDRADAVSEQIKDAIDAHLTENSIDAPTEDRYTPVWQPPASEGPARLDLSSAGVTTVIWATGFRPDHAWIDLPAFDGEGRPAHRRGVTDVDGLYFLGLPWQYTWGSARFSGVAADATYLAGVIGSRAGSRAESRAESRAGSAGSTGSARSARSAPSAGEPAQMTA